MFGQPPGLQEQELNGWGREKDIGAKQVLVHKGLVVFARKLVVYDILQGHDSQHEGDND